MTSTILPTLRASTLGRLRRGGDVRTRIVGILAEARAMLDAPEARDSANAAQVTRYTARLAMLEAVVGEEVSADWYCLDADVVTRDADTVIGAMMGDDRDFAPIANAFAAKARGYASVRAFAV